jgi:chitodextrinase
MFPLEYLSPSLSPVPYLSIADLTNPTAPTGLAASNIGLTSLDLSWTASTDIDDPSSDLTYVVYRNGVQIGTTAPGVTTYHDSGLTANTGYQYTVKAEDPAGNLSAASSTLVVKTSGSGGSAGGNGVIRTYVGIGSTPGMHL